MSVENQGRENYRIKEKRFIRWKSVFTRLLIATSLLYLFEDNVATVELDGNDFRLGGSSCEGVVLLGDLGDKFSLIEQTKPLLGFDMDEPSDPKEVGIVYQSCSFESDRSYFDVFVNNFVVLFKDDYGSNFLRVRLMKLVDKVVRLRLQEPFIKTVYGLGDHKGDAQAIIPVLAKEKDGMNLPQGVFAFRYLGFYVNRYGEWIYLEPDEVSCYGTNPVFLLSWGKHTPYQSVEACEKSFLGWEDTPFSSERCHPGGIISIDLFPESNMGCGENQKDPFVGLPMGDLFPGERLEFSRFCGGSNNRQDCGSIIPRWPIQEVAQKLNNLIGKDFDVDTEK